MTVKDKGYEAFKKNLKKIASTQIRVGAYGEHSGGVSNTVILATAEWGRPEQNIPARYPIRTTIRSGDFQIYFAKMFGEIVKNLKYKPKPVGDALAETVRASIVETIQNRLTPELSQNYLPKKLSQDYSDLPYIATGEFLKKIAAESVQK